MKYEPASLVPQTPDISYAYPNRKGSLTAEARAKHTFGHVDCPACDLTLRDTMGHDPDSIAAMSFSLAGLTWLETRKRHLKPTTAYLYSRHLEHLNLFFGTITVRKIHLGHLRQYQTMRQRNTCAHGHRSMKDCEEGCSKGLWHKRAGPSIINHEMSVVQSILKRAGQWKKMEDHYEALSLPAWQPPKVMSDDEELRLFAIASSNPDWDLAYHVAIISANTSATGTELRNMQLKHVTLDARIAAIVIEGRHLKNDYRPRVIALNGSAQEAIRWCLQRAKSLGSSDTEDYLFPFRNCRSSWDPERPASSSWLRRSWADMREAAGLPWLTPHCLRHQCITLMYENGVDERTIAHTAGHQSERMSRWYSHNRRTVQKTALDSIDPKKRFGPKSVQELPSFGRKENIA